MSKRTTSLSSNSNDCDEVSCLTKQKRLFLRLAIIVLILGPWVDSPAQQRPTCDSLEVAWRYYLYEGDFDKAEALVVNCKDTSAIELRAFIAIKQYKMSLADTLLCKLFQQAKNYEFNPKHLPPPGLTARVEKVKKDLCPRLEKTRFGLRNPPLLIERETNLLPWQEMNIGVSSNLGTEAKNPVIFHARVNLAVLAELEFRTVEIINGLQDGKTQLPTLAIRVQFPTNRMHSQLPVLSTIFRSSLELWDWDTDKRDNMKFQKRLKELRLFISSFEYWRTFEFHAGVSISSLSICPYQRSAVPDDSLCKKSPTTTNLFAAYQWRYQKALLMITWEAVPEYKFDGIVPLAPTTQNVFTINVRALPIPRLAFDLGGIWYRENNFNLKLGATIGFSLSKFF